MSNIYEEVELYVASKGEYKELFDMLKNIQKILPFTDAYIRLISIIGRECNRKNFKTTSSITSICNMLIDELKYIVEKDQISNMKIYEIKSIIGVKLTHS